MKIFGKYFFEDSPEFKSYKEDIAERKRQENIYSCSFEGKNKPVLPTVDLDLMGYAGGGFTGSLPLPQDEAAKRRLKDHQDYAKRGECHKFNEKKYCYHTGKEIISENPIL